ncbi:MAG: tRNA uridine-5-carboxymethylaminomethyl(34) synthesis GTPase MnmE [Deltaproteobacteria bacterium]|nr:tRNA uridine-5-carboxymethylaminomethyl(34) synthesis GTPase MnmE [Deltaproteobacteria bacterium]MBW2117777.1 tRNA uridine-5-carboxymethylaminomethyl(34) synthesis GTPase MnmE [Deltaproteobacteria bacterium]MBW2343353.1 tRNA uridine-5-carboxymethylaminomethyl(34) synthesis GTPase MnmE [Deltaproteobacteria bacterium]
MPSDDDTITAIATPVGQAGIGIIRISGPLSYEIATKLFRPKRSAPDILSHRLYLGDLHDPSSGHMIDEVLLSFMKAPHSYTREDVIEINSHSGYLLLSKILKLILDQGARLARPGEFTLRAFLNGRIDLTQAEAVIDLINSQSEKGLHLAFQQIQGSFREKIENLRQKAIEILASAEVAIDFPEEETGIISREDGVALIEKGLVEPVENLIQAHVRKRIWVDGINTVIVGRVNAGKSSLLNRLLNEQRAIVTPVPGTTRDIIESTITIEGLPLRLMDTAGFREVKDEVERIGVDLTEQKLAEADFLLVVIDRSRPLNRDDLNIIAQSQGKKGLIVINKIDLPDLMGIEAENEMFSSFPIVKISALTGQGLDDLRKAIVECLLEGDIDMTPSHAAANLRHRQALTDAARFFKSAGRSSGEDAPMEIVALELKSGLDALGEIIGETATEDILDSIFSRFCLGK